jgi:hypothetical protein
LERISFEPRKQCLECFASQARTYLWDRQDIKEGWVSKD